MTGSMTSRVGVVLSSWWNLPPPRIQKTHARRIATAIDILAALLIFVAAFVAGMSYLGRVGDYGFFYEDRFAPSVMFALGHGMLNPAREVKAIDQFLARDTQELDHNALPASITTAPLYSTQEKWIYLLYIVGWTWRIFGLSWPALMPVYVAFFALNGVAAYALFRLATGPLLSLAGTALILSSPQTLHMIPFFRDFSKAPFILASLFLLGLLVKTRPRGRRLMLIALVFGAVVGFGMSLRTDLLICVPPACLIILCFIGGKPWHHWGQKCLAIGILLVSVLAVSWPARVRTDPGPSLIMHVILCGQTTDFYELLGLGDVPYTAKNVKHDYYTYSQVAMHARYTQEERHDFDYYTQDYDKAGLEYYFHSNRVFPADFITQCWAAVHQILAYAPFLTGTGSQLRNQVVVGLYWKRWQLFGCLAGTNLVLVLLAMALLFFRSYRTGFAALFLACYFTGYTVLQFELRHFFHLEALFWWSPLFLLAQIIYAARFLSGRQNRETLRKALQWRLMDVMGGFKRIGLGATFLGAIIMCPLAGARAVQNVQARALFDRYEHLPLEPIKTGASMKNSWQRLTPEAPIVLQDTLFGGEKHHVEAGMLAIDLRCPRKMSIQVEYKSTNPNFDSFSHVHPIEALEGMKDARVRVFLPIFQFYNMTDISFDSLLFRKEDVGNIEGIYRVTDISSVPLLMSVNLAENWRQLNLYQRPVRHLRPALVRGAEAEAGNLIVNGSFEEWMEGAAVPQAFLLPATSAAFSEPEPAYTSDGDRAAWLVWTGPVRQGSGAVNFHTEVHQVQPNTTYEFFVDEANFSNASPRMYAWQVKIEGQKTTYTQLDLNINFKPGIRAYEQYSDEFTTFSSEYGDTILIAAVLPSKNEFPVSLLLDNLRLVPQE